MRVILSGGGTAGHIYPALAVAELLNAGGHNEVDFIGTPDSVEARLVEEAGIRFFGLPARGFDRSRPWTLCAAVAVLAVSTLRAFVLMRHLAPDVVVGFGGYVSLPVGLAAILARRPLVVHEQNSVPGLANRVLSRWARAVAVTYESSAASLKYPDRVRVTGNPVRPSVLRGDRSAGREALGVSEDATVLLVFGGSRGARHINEVVAGHRDELLSDETTTVVHVAGRAEVDSVRAHAGVTEDAAGGRYQIRDYISDMGSALAASDLVVSRAGATSIAELTALGVPAVLVPYPYATDDHQTKNAREIAAAGGAIVIEDRELDSPEFVRTVTELLSDAEKRATMAAASRALGHPDAGADVVRTIELVASVRPDDDSREAVR